METATRYIGTCPCCAGQFKVRSSLLVHHGFRRPGDGFIYGDCFGALKTPHELSSETAKNYLNFLRNHLKTVNVAIKQINDSHESVSVEKQAQNKKKLHYLKSELFYIEQSIDRVSGLVNTWKLLPLHTIEEEKQKQEQTKAERKKIREEKKQAKIKIAVENFQKKIDSAERRKNFSALSHIFDSIPRKLAEISGYTIKRPEAFSMVKRDDVWKKLGALKNEQYAENKYHWVIRELKDWPESEG